MTLSWGPHLHTVCQCSVCQGSVRHVAAFGLEEEALEQKHFRRMPIAWEEAAALVLVMPHGSSVVLLWALTAGMLPEQVVSAWVPI